VGKSIPTMGAMGEEHATIGAAGKST
jgi:hypothetical protein